jgi:hypothetical protein
MPLFARAKAGAVAGDDEAEDMSQPNLIRYHEVAVKNDNLMMIT